jgi:hypothetical protein
MEPFKTPVEAHDALATQIPPDNEYPLGQVGETFWKQTSLPASSSPFEQTAFETQNPVAESYDIPGKQPLVKLVQQTSALPSKLPPTHVGFAWQIPPSGTYPESHIGAEYTAAFILIISFGLPSLSSPATKPFSDWLLFDPVFVVKAKPEPLLYE